ncbi:transporter substrate-binding domain-containing protein [Pararobbsia alpina]|uniref:Aliphatic amidase expression-regulating protein n=1 Tax=Pararobbsia alpina TaxID=621374 RepID=A0A6S7C527_9BURK|nr:transporter substrate-binding domain-containing protein [Pararobbsia alpina]CAB3801567.1 Aliphatic amidase expression-regulating protein [Pararobbsia alpina]
MSSPRYEPVKIGVLYSTTGVTGLIESSQQSATLFAADEINRAGGINGREVQLHVRDPGSVAANYASMAEELIVEKGVRLIMGCYMSSGRKLVIPVVERHNALLFYPTLYEGFEYSRNVFCTGTLPNQTCVPLADYMLEKFGSRVFMIGSDYIYPYETSRIMKDLVFERGGETVGEIYVPLDASEDHYRAIATRIASQSPDFVFSTVVGVGVERLYRSFAKSGLDPSVTPIASVTTSEAEIAAMGAHLGEGHFTSASYFQCVDTAMNRSCLDNYRRFMGGDAVTNMCWEAAYFQMQVLANAMRDVGSDNPVSLLRAIPGMEFDAPQGRIRMDEENHHAYLHTRIGRANATGQFDIVASMPERLRADPFVIVHTPVNDGPSAQGRHTVAGG